MDNNTEIFAKIDTVLSGLREQQDLQKLAEKHGLNSRNAVKLTDDTIDNVLVGVIAQLLCKRSEDPRYNKLVTQGISKRSLKTEIINDYKNQAIQLINQYKNMSKEEIQECYNVTNEPVVQEEKLSTDERNELSDDEFGIPEKRKFPLNDADHVEAAVKMFPHADASDKEALAKRILRKAHEFGMDTSGWDSINKYVVVQESAWNDIRNGVNPWSMKRVFHISPEGHLDGQIFKPRVPEYLDKYDPSKTEFEDVETPRVCFSPSIEGCLNAILVNIGRWKTANKLRDWYVYIPEKPLKEYKYRTNKQLIDEKKVYDANLTREIWIEEPVRLKQYGIIRIDSVVDVNRKKAVPTTLGESKKRNVYNFKWHWLVKPKILKDVPYDYSPKSVCEDMVDELSRFKYGLGYDGSIHHGSSKDFDEKYRFESPEDFEKNGGGICYDYVEWQAGYLEAYGYTCRKFYISTDTEDMDTHTFILVNDGNGKFIYPEAAFKLLEGTYTVKFLDEAIDMIMKKVWDINDNKSKYDKIKYYVWEYKDHPPYGSDMKTCHEYFTKGEPIGEGMIKNPYKRKN